MPPPKYTKPEFSPVGRYLIDVSMRRDNPIFHDTEYIKEACAVESIASGNMSRFNAKAWATSRGFIQCSNCKGE